MFALNFELLPRDLTAAPTALPCCPFPPPFAAASLKMLAAAEAACHPRWGIAPHKGNEHFASTRRRQRQKQRQLRSLAKVANWLERNGKWKRKSKGKAFPEAARRKWKTPRTAAKQTKTKRNEIEANRNRSPEKAQREGVGRRAWQTWREGVGNLCREIEILNLPLHLSRISIWAECRKRIWYRSLNGVTDGRMAKRGSGRRRWHAASHRQSGTQGPAKHLIWRWLPACALPQWNEHAVCQAKNQVTKTTIECRQPTGRYPSICDKCAVLYAVTSELPCNWSGIVNANQLSDIISLRGGVFELVSHEITSGIHLQQQTSRKCVNSGYPSQLTTWTIALYVIDRIASYRSINSIDNYQ